MNVFLFSMSICWVEPEFKNGVQKDLHQTILNSKIVGVVRVQKVAVIHVINFSV